MPSALAGVSAAVALVVARLVLRLTALMLVVQGTNELKPYSLLEGGNVFQLQSFRVVGQRGSLSRGAQPSLPSRMQVHPLCPRTQMV